MAVLHYYANRVSFLGLQFFKVLCMGVPFLAAYRTVAAMLLLLLHFAQNGLLLDLDQRAAFFFAELQPKFANLLAFFAVVGA